MCPIFLDKLAVRGLRVFWGRYRGTHSLSYMRWVLSFE